MMKLSKKGDYDVVGQERWARIMEKAVIRLQANYRGFKARRIIKQMKKRAAAEALRQRRATQMQRMTELSGNSGKNFRATDPAAMLRRMSIDKSSRSVATAALYPSRPKEGSVSHQGTLPSTAPAKNSSSLKEKSVIKKEIKSKGKHVSEKDSNIKTSEDDVLALAASILNDDKESKPKRAVRRKKRRSTRRKKKIDASLAVDAEESVVLGEESIDAVDERLQIETQEAVHEIATHPDTGSGGVTNHSTTVPFNGQYNLSELVQQLNSIKIVLERIEHQQHGVSNGNNHSSSIPNVIVTGTAGGDETLISDSQLNAYRGSLLDDSTTERSNVPHHSATVKSTTADENLKMLLQTVETHYASAQATHTDICRLMKENSSNDAANIDDEGKELIQNLHGKVSNLYRKLSNDGEDIMDAIERASPQSSENHETRTIRQLLQKQQESIEMMMRAVRSIEAVTSHPSDEGSVSTMTVSVPNKKTPRKKKVIKKKENKQLIEKDEEKEIEHTDELINLQAYLQKSQYEAKEIERMGYNELLDRAQHDLMVLSPGHPYESRKEKQIDVDISMELSDNQSFRNRTDLSPYLKGSHLRKDVNKLIKALHPQHGKQQKKMLDEHKEFQYRNWLRKQEMYGAVDLEKTLRFSQLQERLFMEDSFNGCFDYNESLDSCISSKQHDSMKQPQRFNMQAALLATRPKHETIIDNSSFNEEVSIISSPDDTMKRKNQMNEQLKKQRFIQINDDDGDDDNETKHETHETGGAFDDNLMKKIQHFDLRPPRQIQSTNQKIRSPRPHNLIHRNPFR